MKYDVSIIVATYNPDTEKLISTLNSCISQEGISFEIIITDDGSVKFPRAEIEDYMRSAGFDRITYCIKEINKGTVINLIDGLQMSSGEYVKFISPGDLLSDKKILADWLSFVKKKKALWSFGDVKFYNGDKVFDKKLRPIVIKPYIWGFKSLCRKNYVLNNDLCIGAATLIQSELMMSYLKRIEGKIKYGEDNVFRMMMLEGICAEYYSRTVIDYEYGEGISTAENSGLNPRLQADWNVATEMMCNPGESDDALASSLRRCLQSSDKANNIFTAYFWRRKLFGIQRVLFKR
jgi:glycosyltransferase involved in cell wall biosynthesis